MTINAIRQTLPQGQRTGAEGLEEVLEMPPGRRVESGADGEVRPRPLTASRVTTTSIDFWQLHITT